MLSFRNFLSVLITLLTIHLNGQDNEVLFTGSREVKPGRYESILGSPMLFEQDVLLDIVNRNGTLCKALIGNFNGYSHHVEVMQGSKRMILDLNQFTIVKCNTSDSILLDLILIKGAHPKFPDKLMVQLFRGQKYTLLMDYHFKISQRKISNYGKPLVLKEFQLAPVYFLQKDNDFFRIKLNQKSILKKLDDRKTALDILDIKQYDLSRESGVIDLLKNLESVKAD